MQRDMQKLDQFKRSIMQSIKDEEVAPAALTTTSFVNDSVYAAAAGAGAKGTYSDSYVFGGGRPYSPPMRSPAPAAAPPLTDSYRVGGGFGGAAQLSSSIHRCAAAVPITPACADSMPPPPMPPPAAADLTGSSANLDGKDFFRQARLRLTYEQFNQFLSNIKKLNDHVQTRDETLAQANEIFGQENHDLFLSFTELLSKHGLT
eukprot:6208207-Prymnesium_polylepis.1